MGVCLGRSKGANELPFSFWGLRPQLPSPPHPPPLDRQRNLVRKLTPLGGVPAGGVGWGQGALCQVPTRNALWGFPPLVWGTISAKLDPIFPYLSHRVRSPLRPAWCPSLHQRHKNPYFFQSLKTELALARRIACFLDFLVESSRRVMPYLLFGFCCF